MAYHGRSRAKQIALGTLLEIAMALLLLVACQATQYPNCQGSGNPVTVTLCADQTIAQAGRPVHLTLTITNYDKKPLTVDLSKPVVDITVSYNVEVRAKWSDQQPTGAIVNHLDLEPNKSRVIEMTWIPHTGDELLTFQITGVVWLDDRFRVAVPMSMCVKVCYQ